MMEFFEVSVLGLVDDGVIAVDRPGRQVFAYVRATGLWHRREDLVGPVCRDRDQLVGQGRLRRLEDHGQVGQVLALERRRRGRAEQWSDREAEQLTRAGQVLTSAEVGLEVHHLAGERPITTPGLPELVRSRRRNWTHLSLYAPDATHSAPFTAVKTAQGTPRFDPPLEAIREVDPLTQQTRVKIRGARQEPQERPERSEGSDSPAEAGGAVRSSSGRTGSTAVGSAPVVGAQQGAGHWGLQAAGR